MSAVSASTRPLFPNPAPAVKVWTLSLYPGWAGEKETVRGPTVAGVLYEEVVPRLFSSSLRGPDTPTGARVR